MRTCRECLCGKSCNVFGRVECTNREAYIARFRIVGYGIACLVPESEAMDCEHFSPREEEPHEEA